TLTVVREPKLAPPPAPRDNCPRVIVVDLSPLLAGAQADELSVAGVSVGDAADAIDRAALTGAEENAPGESRTYSNGRIYRNAPAGRLVEVPLAERVEATLRQGGWLRVHDVALDVQGGVVARIFVRGPSLATLRIAREADIARALGPADGHDRKIGWHIHHY